WLGWYALENCIQWRGGVRSNCGEVCALDVHRGSGGAVKVMKKQLLLIGLGALFSLGAGSAALGQNGFYGGVSMRNGAESNGLQLGDTPLAWNRFSAPASDDASQRALLFGGYRWRNDLSVEAAVNTANTADKYALRQGAPTSIIGPGAGLALTDASARSWNADVYTSWEMIRSL